MRNTRKLAVVALALGAALLAAGAAQARGHDAVQWSITIGAPIGLPVYSEPYPVCAPPAPVYAPAPAYYYPAEPRYPAPRYHRAQPTRWDGDGDGIPNRYDRVYNPRWDRDGDGIPNWRDRRDGRGSGR